MKTGSVLTACALLPGILVACADTCEGPDQNGYYYCEKDPDEKTDDEESEGDFSLVEILLELAVDDEPSEPSTDCTPLPLGAPCGTREAVTVRLDVRVGSPVGIMPERIDVYRGDFEDRNLLGSVAPLPGEYRLTASAEPLSAAAVYALGSDTIVAVDGGRVSAKAVYYCGTVCYESKPIKLDLTLGDCFF